MVKGDKLNPVEIGHQDIDIKTLLKDAGYIVPQTSAGKLTKIPSDVQLQIEELEQARENYETLEETANFKCPYCGEKNSGHYKKEISTGTVFLICGNCNTVVEVK